MRGWLMLQCTMIVVVVVSVSTSAAKGGCELIDSTRPAVNLSYSITQDEFARLGQVGLTFQNNTTCLVLVESNGESDPVNLRFVYEIQNARRTSVPTHKGYWADDRDQVFFEEIPPGKSLNIGIDKTHATRKHTISVSYLFSWEVGGKSGDAEHRVYFASSSWPRRR